MIVHEFLPLFIGQEMVEDILRQGRRFYRPAVAQIPVEFQGAAYRFGHTLVRPSYRANLAGDSGQPFFGMIFDPRGRRQRPRRSAGWRAGAPTLHRLADLLQFRRNSSTGRPARHPRGRREAQQIDRREDFHAAVQPSAWRDRVR